MQTDNYRAGRYTEAEMPPEEFLRARLGAPRIPVCRIVDAIMIRRAAAEISPQIRPDGVAVVSYTAMRWTALLRRPC